MNRSQLVSRVRSNTRDLTSSIFRFIDIADYLNESIDRFKSSVPELSTMSYLTSDEQTPTPLPSAFHYLLATYATSRCFAQDERHYQASTLMNEFESKLEELIMLIEDGRVQILDLNNQLVQPTYPDDYVRNVYFKTTDEDIDLGVDGVV